MLEWLRTGSEPDQHGTRNSLGLSEPGLQSGADPVDPEHVCCRGVAMTTGFLSGFHRNRTDSVNSCRLPRPVFSPLIGRCRQRGPSRRRGVTRPGPGSDSGPAGFFSERRATGSPETTRETEEADGEQNGSVLVLSACCRLVLVLKLWTICPA